MRSGRPESKPILLVNSSRPFGAGESPFSGHPNLPKLGPHDRPREIAISIGTL